jgi:hypothetical protein
MIAAMAVNLATHLTLVAGSRVEGLAVLNRGVLYGFC